MELKPYQEEALSKMKKGCILCGGVGSGKTITSLAYYYTWCGGVMKPRMQPMKKVCDLYIITTAHVRDTKQWNAELANYNLVEGVNTNGTKIFVDSWNNIRKYEKIENAFFIFDEQRVCGGGVWSKTFIKIARKNEWILLSATPGDCWNDYGPVFVANGFFENITQFRNEHIRYARYSGNYPRIAGYLGTAKLNRLKQEILIPMLFERSTTQHHAKISVEYNKEIYKYIMKNRCNPETGEPFQSVAELCYALRKVVNSDSTRIECCMNIVRDKKKVIIFYNYDYELDLLKDALRKELPEFTVAEWNGHAHEALPTTEAWVYLVQYAAGAEGWNCITTDSIIFYSQTYSYKSLIQAAGRTDRMNTPFENLYYFHLRSAAPIDLAIAKALHSKKQFNESNFIKKCNS